MATTSNKMRNAAESLEENLEGFGDQTKGAAKTVGTEVREAASNVAEKTSSVATKTAESLKGAACFVGDKAEQATGAVGAGMESLGAAIREHTPDKGVLGNAGDAVADKLEGAGHYLEEHGLKGLGADVTKMIRNNPIPALLIGVGVGFLLARMVRR